MRFMAERTELQPGAPCPICGKPEVARFHPFCSARCADVDLNRWLSGVYVVPGRTDDDEDGAPAEPDARNGDPGEDGA
jgi:endogenous inhibitor of DNA gyrase (YacG/DUF329 family)